MREDINLSGGHNTKDPGAINKDSVKEADLTRELKDLVLEEIKICYSNNVTVKDNWETNTQYQNRLRSKRSDELSITFDIHFNSAGETANGTETVIAKNASKMSRAFALEIQNSTVRILKTRDRGVITDDRTPRGKIGILHLAGPAALIEVCFISNPEDMKKYHANKRLLAKEYAILLVKYDNLLNNKYEK